MVYEGGWIGLRHRCSELTQLQSACCGDEEDNDIDEDDDDTLRRKPRVKQTEEKNIRKGGKITERVSVKQNKKQTKKKGP